MFCKYKGVYMKSVTITIDLSNVNTDIDYMSAIAKAVHEFSQLEDKFFKTQVINELKALNAGNKGRISVPEFMKKAKEVSQGNGKKGRPSDSDEVKLQKLEAKLAAEKAKLLNKSSEEISA